MLPLLAWIVATAAAAPAVDEQAVETRLTASIAELERTDPGSPAALNGRLEYADFLLNASKGECRKRLDDAQSQVDTAGADPSFEIVLPDGLARQADLEYRIHTARASCRSSQPGRRDELHQALAAAQRAVELYREALDYQSMVVMQFDVAATQRLLGNDAAAVAALQSTIDLDHEYGFRDDASDNSELLAQWLGKTAGPTPPLDTPARTTTLKFGWTIRNAQVATNLSYARVIDGAIERYQGARTFKRTFRESLLYWRVADEHGEVVFDTTKWPQDPDLRQVLALTFGRALLETPDIEVRKGGDFSHAFSLHNPAVKQLDPWFAPGLMEEKAAEEYDFDTGIWTGATLEQGVWYEMSAPLILPGTPGVVLPHDIEFAYTHPVPCEADSNDPSCVELVVRATPQAQALGEFNASWGRAMKLPHGEEAHYWSATYMRIVTDPNTLMTSVRDVRNYWHTSHEGAVLEEIGNQADRIMTTSIY